MTSTDVGELVLVRMYEPDKLRDTVRIRRADPRARITGELMRQIAADECEPPTSPWRQQHDRRDDRQHA